MAAARRAGALFIADEVQPGFGRTGAALWGFERHGVEPDFVTMGKPMGNGFPMAAMAVRPDLLEPVLRNLRLLQHLRRQSGGCGRGQALSWT